MAEIFTIMEALRNQAKELSLFETAEDVKKTVTSFYDRHYFNPKERQVIETILGHALVVPGVCWVRLDQLVAKAGVSRSTYHRTLNKAEELGLLKRIYRTKPNGRRASNFVVIQPQENIDDTSNETAKKSSEALPLQEKTDKKSVVAFKSITNLKPDDYIYTLDANFRKYGIQEIGKSTTQIPARIIHQIKETACKRYAGYSFDANVNDLMRAIAETDEIFTKWFRAGHPIASYGGFYCAIFEGQLLQRKTKRDIAFGRASASYEMMLCMDTPDRRAWFFQYVLGGGRKLA
ncbi:hypothetical protein P4H46_09740 [Paenibacillus glucanolyticus]|uniref:hypothetical protein n=1 Tax=Paenibacillus glucanolyticus TaxID=59843 RepID=UPI0022AD7FAF|nr:hypothetical protein [Staphylococcus aureus]